MSYKETEETLKRLLNKLESLEAEFLVERDVYREAFKQDLTAAKNVIKKLNEGSWYFDMNGLMHMEISHKNDKGLYDDNAVGRSSKLVEIAPDRSLFPFKEMKKRLIRGIFECIQGTESVQQLEYLRDVTLRDAETAENKITESFYEELSDILNPNYESYHALEAMWSELVPTISGYQEKVSALVRQVSKEWLDEGYISKGDLFNPLSYATDDLCKVEKIENGKIYLDTGVEWEMNSIHPSILELSWKSNHPQFRIDDILKPLDSVADWKLGQQV